MTSDTGCKEIVNLNFILVLYNLFNSSPFPIIHFFHRPRKDGTIQYVYRKLGTHARVFPQTLLHGNSKNEIR